MKEKLLCKLDFCQVYTKPGAIYIRRNGKLVIEISETSDEECTNLFLYPGEGAEIVERSKEEDFSEMEFTHEVLQDV